MLLDLCETWTEPTGLVSSNTRNQSRVRPQGSPGKEESEGEGEDQHQHSLDVQTLELLLGL